MKRLFLCVLCVSTLLSFCACARQKAARIRENFAFPLEFNAAFQIGELAGNAHFVINEGELNFGVTQGDLRGLVAHITEDSARFLYGGMDLSFPAAATRSLRTLHQAFLTLNETDLTLNEIPETKESYSDLSLEDGNARVFFDPQTDQFIKLSATFHDTEITLNLQE